MGELNRVRLTFGKLGRLRYIGHLDLARTWERVLRRAGVRLAYTGGFNPRPRMQFAGALPLGITSECELLDIWLTERVHPDELPAGINAVAPEGLKVYRAEEVPLRAPALQSLLRAAEYEFSFLDDLPDVGLGRLVSDFLARDRVIRLRRGREIDIRHMVWDLRAEGGGLVAILAAGEHGNLRPDDLLDELGLAGVPVRVHRRRLIFEGD